MMLLYIFIVSQLSNKEIGGEIFIIYTRSQYRCSLLLLHLHAPNVYANTKTTLLAINLNSYETM